MLGAMFRPVPLLCALSLLAVPTVAQKTLAELQKQFVAESQQLDEKQGGREGREQLLARQIGVLRAFLDEQAAGDDRWNGRLMLADMNMARGDRDQATTALRAIDAKAAPALLLVSAASMAQHLGLRGERDRWIEAATAKDAPLADRMAMARLLMTALHEVERGEAIFAKALAAASDDEQRAQIRWNRADALRDREDLPDNTGFDELDKLAKELPNTYWGSVARDRLRATQLKAGDDAIAVTATARDGSKVDLAQLRGKAVVLAFWSAGDHDTPRLIEFLQDQHRRAGGELVVLGICLDRDDAAIGEAAKKLGFTFPLVGDGKGIQQDIALRWFVEGPVVHVLDRNGKVSALGLHVGTADGRAELNDAIDRALKRS
jgi:peroxiredoxin